MTQQTTLKQKILETWELSDEINVAVGLTTDSDEQLPHQINIAYSEFCEGMLAIKDNDEEEKYDGLIDLHVTVIPCAMMYAGNKSLLDGTYDYDLNPEGMDFNDLLHEAQSYFLSTKHSVRHFQSAVDVLCDLTNASDIDVEKVVKYFDAVNTSNKSKFPVVGTVDPESECDYIESKGRYTDVYFEEGELLGEKVYIFKSKYDKEHNERFPNGKYLKPSVFVDVKELL